PGHLDHELLQAGGQNLQGEGFDIGQIAQGDRLFPYRRTRRRGGAPALVTIIVTVIITENKAGIVGALLHRVPPSASRCKLVRTRRAPGRSRKPSSNRTTSSSLIGWGPGRTPWALSSCCWRVPTCGVRFIGFARRRWKASRSS